MPAPRPRTILHVDLDAFFAAVEQRDDPTLRGKPVIVGGASPRGVVAAASYEVRVFGVRSAMPTSMALARCPHAIVLPPRHHHYAQVSRQFFAILEHYSPLVEGLSLDEAFLDVSGEESLFGDGATIGRLIKDRVRAELELVVSVGVAPSKFVAKIASDLGKPDGLLVVGAAGVLEFLRPLPVSRLWGVGAATDEILARIGLRTIGQVARAGEPLLAAQLGADRAHHLYSLAQGLDERDVIPERAPVSVGHEETFAADCFVRARLIPHLLGQADRSAPRLRRLGLRAQVLTVKIKYANHEIVTRRTTLPRASTDQRLFGETARALLDEVPAIERRGVRLTGVSLSNLTPEEAPRQLLLDEKQAVRGEQLGHAIDAFAARFGDGKIKRGVLLADD